jgi:hypothetical protein
VDDPIPIEGIIEGEPASLASVCAAGGSAIVAYCWAVGAETHIADTAVAALATFRRGVVENADQDPSQLEHLLLSATAHAARRVAGVNPSRDQLQAGQAALEGAVTGPLTPGLAPRIIRALVEAAPVTALGGDAGAVRRAAEEHYIRVFGEAQPPAPPPAGAAAWVPPELLGLDDTKLNAGAVTSNAEWGPPADGPAAAAAVSPAGAPPSRPLDPAADAQAGAPAAAAAQATPPVKPPPGALVIKRGDHWPFRRRPPRRPSHGATRGSARNLLAAGAVGLALGAGIGVVATPDKTVRENPILVRPIDSPFTVDGAVFNVARTSQAIWARAIRRRALRPGRTWLTLAAQTRNVRRANFHPRGLGYRLRTPAGIVIGPDTALVAGEIPAVGGRLPIGKRTSVHLGFQVPSGQRDLTLEFDPSPRGRRIHVPLN